MECPAKLLYTKEHEWVAVDCDTCAVGITDYAQSQLGDVVFVELPQTGTAVKASETFGVVESVKSVSDLYSPVSGEIAETNADLESEPEIVNDSPYERGWMIKIKMSDESELDGLLTAEQYGEYIDSLQ
jgi:glycine cleavage system H protein